MLKLRAQHGIGQYYPPQGQGLLFPIPSPYRPLDPTVDLALTAAGQGLAVAGDPGAPETAALIRRILVAQGFGTQTTASKVSDLNPTLKFVATVRENPIVSVLGAVAIPVLAFMLGRSSARR